MKSTKFAKFKPVSEIAHTDNRIESKSRRNFLMAASAFSAAGVLGNATSARAEKLNYKSNIVILGSGMAGLGIAARLRRNMPNATIKIVDSQQSNYYQPGFTLVGAGIWKRNILTMSNSDFIPKGVEWVQEDAVEIDPESQTIKTSDFNTINYDFLVVAVGTQLNYGDVEGMDVNAIGHNGLADIYAGPDQAEATWSVMQKFIKKGGQALIAKPGTDIKCPGAPLKTTFLLRDRAREAKALERIKITYHTPGENVFGSVPALNDIVLKLWDGYNIDVAYKSQLSAIDIIARKATFTNADDTTSTYDYDFMDVIPPQSAPDVVRYSPLAVQEGKFKGWLEVDQLTLQHKRYPNVFGCGDVNGTPKGKTGATVKKSSPIVANNLMEVIDGKTPSKSFDGYTSCPLITKIGSAILIEFDYDGNLTPSMPFLDPLQESYFAWFMKTYLLKAAYTASIKGHV
jgi:sulfide:quinone oxidoreductase